MGNDKKKSDAASSSNRSRGRAPRRFDVAVSSISRGERKYYTPMILRFHWDRSRRPMRNGGERQLENVIKK